METLANHWGGLLDRRESERTMSDYLQSLNPSDSGFLNAFIGPTRQPVARGVESRVGGDTPLASEAANDSRADLDEMLRGAPVPHDLQDRLHRMIDTL